MNVSHHCTADTKLLIHVKILPDNSIENRPIANWVAVTWTTVYSARTLAQEMTDIDLYIFISMVYYLWICHIGNTNRNVYFEFDIKLMYIETGYNRWHRFTFYSNDVSNKTWDYDTQMARFIGPTWDPPGDDRTQVGPMLAPITLLSG